MTTGGIDGLSPAGRRARNRHRPLSWILAGFGVVLVFALGIALGQALEENPSPDETRTSVRTLVPATLPAETVTVTIPAP